jgi:hypothetical protein
MYSSLSVTKPKRFVSAFHRDVLSTSRLLQSTNDTPAAGLILAQTMVYLTDLVRNHLNLSVGSFNAVQIWLCSQTDRHHQSVNATRMSREMIFNSLRILGESFVALSLARS